MGFSTSEYVGFMLSLLLAIGWPMYVLETLETRNQMVNLVMFMFPLIVVLVAYQLKGGFKKVKW